MRKFTFSFPLITSLMLAFAIVFVIVLVVFQH